MDLFSAMYYFLSTIIPKDPFPVYKKIFSLSHFIFCPLSHQKILSLLQKDLFSCSKNISFMSHIYFLFQSHRSVWGPYSKKNSELFSHLLQPLQIYLQPMLLGNSKGIPMGITMSTPTLTLEGNTLHTHG